MKYDKTLNLRINTDLYQKLEKTAKKEKKKVSEVARDILTKHYAEEKVDYVVDSFLSTILNDPELQEIIAKKLKRITKT